MIKSTIRFFLENKLVAYLLLIIFIGWGIITAPFEFGIDFLPRDPIAVDAIPDIGENQQIVYTEWMGRSPQNVEDQITYPLTTALLGIPGVKSIRSNSMFGFSSIYIIFEEDIEFYWSRSRVLEKLNALPQNTLPVGVQPSLGPDATALGQIFWYTLEGRDNSGNPTGGWDLQELRSIQDFYVRYGLSAAEGVAEVASIGGFVKEYQVDIDPVAMKANGIRLEQVMAAIKGSNLDIGAQTLEINLAEYFVRGLGYVQKLEDIEKSVVIVHDNIPVRIGDIARVSLAPANRRGVLDKSGSEAVGGVVIARYGSNPMAVINHVKEKIIELGPGLPKKTLKDGTVSQVSIVPFYDRTQLINETIGTLHEALSLEILITIIVVILMLFNLRSSLMISGTLPVAVLMCFIAMKYFGVDANIVALSGIAIAIGTMVDMGIVLTESIVNRLEEAPPDESLLETVYQASTEVASAIITAVATTIISFLPVFTMQASEGKLFRPLAFTKTFALVSSIIIAITILPALAHSLFSMKARKKMQAFIVNVLAIVAGVLVSVFIHPFSGYILILAGLGGIAQNIVRQYSRAHQLPWMDWLINILYAGIVAWLLAIIWMPLGVNKSSFSNFLFIAIIAGGLIGLFFLIIHFYERILRFLLRFKVIFLLVVSFIVYQGFMVFQKTGEEFMPALDEGSFLLMPTAMPHAGMQENIKNLRLLDMSVSSIPEVETVVGKAGRINSALDPAPMSMYENIILYKSEYMTDESGHRIRFRFEDGDYVRDENGALIPDRNGVYFRQWRDEIKSPDDIWNEIVSKTHLPGVTSAPKLQPIETRLVMLQTGMRAPMGIKVRGSNLDTIEQFGLVLEKHLKETEGVQEAAVFAERIVGKPYLLLDIDRDMISRYGLTISKVQEHIQAAIGGMEMSQTVEGRERYSIRIRYPRELRDDPETLERIYIPTANGEQIPLGDLVDIRYEQGPQSIKSEDGFLVGYVLFDKLEQYSEVEVVHLAQKHLQQLIDIGTIRVPDGLSYRFAGNYEQQVRANKRLSIVLPLALAIIFLILYFQFNSIMISAMVFTGVFIAFAGGFIMIGLYDTSWFLNFDFLGTNMRELFQIRTINLSVAVWVGFLALFGIATDDGVLVATFLKDSFKKSDPGTREEIRDAVVAGGLRRVRPAMMTTATTILALIPVLSSTGRGSDIMLPMAIPSFGGMTLQIITMFTVPVLFSLWKESKLKFNQMFKNNLHGRKGIHLVIIFIMAGACHVSAQSLEELIQIAEQQNTEIKALEKVYESAVMRAPQVNKLPDPELGLAAFPLPVETRLGAQIARISVGQMFPWFGMLKQRSQNEKIKAEIFSEQVEIARIRVLYELKSAYLKLYNINRSQEILRKRMIVFDGLEKLALSKVESGKSTLADVIRVQLKMQALQQEIDLLEENKSVYISKINQLLDRSMDTKVEVTDSFGMTSNQFDRKRMKEDLEKWYPGLQMLEVRQKISASMIELNRLNSKPTFGLGADYILVRERTDAFPESNGRDIIQMRASVRVPLYREQYSAKDSEERLKIESLEYEYESVRSGLYFQVEEAYTQLENARINWAFSLRQKELCETAIQILESSYSSDVARFDELLGLEQELIEYEMKMLKAIIQSQEAKFSLERFEQQK